MFYTKRKVFIYTFIVAAILLSVFSGYTALSKSKIVENPIYSEKELLAHYIDVGQGDAILLQIHNKNLLIDSGPSESSTKLIQYLASHKVYKLDYIIATHPHEDHIGNMKEIIQKFNIGQIYAPKKSSPSKSFESMIYALKNKNLKINVAKPDTNLDLGSNINATIIGPPYSSYDEINNYSSIIKVTFGSTSFLFMGDAEKLVENQLIYKGINISADVIKIGHHGSNSSSSDAFLDRVNPKYAIISCGKNNEYGHPHKSTLDSLKARNITVYRTDLDKDIIIRSDGNKINKE